MRSLLAGLLLLASCSSASPPPPLAPPLAAPPKPSGKIQLLVTVDWEGRELAEPNLAAIAALRRRFPTVRLVHFLNAAYFTKPNADAVAVKAKIAGALAPSDERGLHIHGWKRLFEAAGVTFRSESTFWGKPLRSDCTVDCGHEVAISSYTAAELRKVVRFSLDKLGENGFGGIVSFRCGGWVATDSVREAIAAEGLRFDESAVPATFLEPKLKGLPLLADLSKLWEGTTSTSQPFRMKTAAGDIVEVPDNGALADYVSADDMFGTWEKNRDAWMTAGRTKNVVVSIGFHQETAARYLPNVEAALARIFERAKAEGIPVESVVTTEIDAPR